MTHDTLQTLKDKPVRMFGKRPDSDTRYDVVDNPSTNSSKPSSGSSDPLFDKMTPEEIFEAYEADTESEDDDDL